MARQKRSRDWQERAFEVTQDEQKVRAAGTQSDATPAARAWNELPHRSPWKWTLGGIAAIAVALLIRGGLNDRAPALTKSCTTPTFVLSSQKARQGATIRWAATGPPTTRFLITIGVGSLRQGAKPGQVHAVPDSGLSSSQTQEAVFPHVLSTSCTTHSGLRGIGAVWLLQRPDVHVVGDVNRRHIGQRRNQATHRLLTVPRLR